MFRRQLPCVQTQVPASLRWVQKSRCALLVAPDPVGLYWGRHICFRPGWPIYGASIYMLQIRLAYTWGRHMLLACVNLSSSGDSTKWTDLPIHCRIWFKQQKTCVIFIDNHETPGWVNFGSIQRCYIFARIQVQPFIRVQRSVLQASLPVYQAKQILPHSPCDTSKTQISLDSERSFYK